MYKQTKHIIKLNKDSNKRNNKNKTNRERRKNKQIKTSPISYEEINK